MYYLFLYFYLVFVKVLLKVTIVSIMLVFTVPLHYFGVDTVGLHHCIWYFCFAKEFSKMLTLSLLCVN